MGKKYDYSKELKKTLGGLVDRLELSDLRKDFLKNRWLDQVMWLEGRAKKEQSRHHLLRMVTIVGGVLVPVMVSISSPTMGASSDEASISRGRVNWGLTIGWVALGISQTVAISAAIEEFFGHGDKYRNYRATAESMKIEGWQFLQLTGPYRRFEHHEGAYRAFAQRVELFIQKDVDGFVARMEEKQDEDREDAEQAIANGEQALLRLNQELDLRAQRLAAEEQRLATQAAQNELSASQGSSFETVSSSEDFGGAEAVVPAGHSHSGAATPVAAEPPAALPPLGAHALVWAEGTSDKQGIKPFHPVVQNYAALVNGRGGESSSGAKAGVAAVATPTVPQLVTPKQVAEILECSLEDCETYLPGVLAAMKKHGMLEKNVLIGLLATIRVETGGFRPIPELGGDDYFTANYEGRRDLGNVQPGDGVKYHGRGYVQLTGRSNYTNFGKMIGVDLANEPDLAMNPEISAQLLVLYFKKNGVDTAARTPDWRQVRKLVNGGYNGWKEFDHYVKRAMERLG